MAEGKYHLIGNKMLVARWKICYDSRGEESVEREGGWKGSAGQLTDHLTSLSMTLLDGRMRKGDGP